MTASTPSPMMTGLRGIVAGQLDGQEAHPVFDEPLAGIDAATKAEDIVSRTTRLPSGDYRQSSGTLVSAR